MKEEDHLDNRAYSVMRLFTAIIILLSGCSAKCAKKKVAMIGMKEAELIRAFSIPDFVIEQSGDLARYYLLDEPPGHRWPKTSEKTYYYLAKGMQVLIVNKRVEKVGPITLNEAGIQKILEDLD